LTARHRVTLTNEGNAPARAVLSGKDRNGALRFKFKSDGLSAVPAATAETGVMVKPRKWKWIAPGKSHQFTITAQPEGGEPQTVDGVMDQTPILPRWAPRALIGLIIFAVGAVLLLRSNVFDSKPAANKGTTTIAPPTTSGPTTTGGTGTTGGGG